MPIVFRELTAAELPQAVDLAEQLAAEGPVDFLPDLQSRRTRIERLGELLLATGGLLGAVDGARVVAALGLLVIDDARFTRPIAGELCFYIDRDYRKGTIGRQLLQLAERWACSKKCSMLQIAAAAADSRRLGPVYRRRGFVEVETMWIKELR